MSDENFIRSYSLVVGENKKSGKAFELGVETLDSPHSLHISFSIEKSTSSEANTAKVQIWNLSSEHRKMLEKKNVALWLSAGYDGSNALILAGNVTNVITTRDNADRLTEIEVVDGRLAISKTPISCSYKGSVSCKKIIEEIVRVTGVSVRYSKSTKFATFRNGFSFAGTAKEALNKVCNKSNLRWSMQNGVLHICKHGESVSSIAYLINADTGLIGSPERIKTEKTVTTKVEVKSKDKKAKYKTKKVKKSVSGYRIEYLLNGAIGINDFIKLVSKKKTGYFLVDKLQIDGDNLSGDWKCTAQILEVK